MATAVPSIDDLLQRYQSYLGGTPVGGPTQGGFAGRPVNMGGYASNANMPVNGFTSRSPGWDGTYGGLFGGMDPGIATAVGVSNTQNGLTPPVFNPGTGAQTGGGQVDYQALIDSILGPLRSQYDAAHTSDLAGRNAAINRTLVTLGLIPDTAAAGKALGFDFSAAIDPTTKALAEAANNSGVSTEARLSQAHADQVRQIRNSLAARGLLDSGETGFQLGRADTAYNRSQYDALQKVLDMISGFQSAYTNADLQRQQALANQTLAATQQAAAQGARYGPSTGPGGVTVGGDTGGAGGGGTTTVPPVTPPPGGNGGAGTAPTPQNVDWFTHVLGQSGAALAKATPRLATTQTLANAVPVFGNVAKSLFGG